MSVPASTWSAEISAVDSPLVPLYLAAAAGEAPTARTTPDHLTASGLVLCDGHVLLVLHRKVGLWLQPGGHVDDADSSLAAAALRECVEETGVAGLTVDPVPVLLDVHPAPCGARTHLDVQFVVRAPALVAPVVSSESLDVRWFPIDALPEQRVDLSVLVKAAARR